MTDLDQEWDGRAQRRLARFTPEQIELHRMVMKHIEAEPERWDQTHWVGGTAFDARVGEIDRAHDDYDEFMEALGVEWDVNQCGTTMCYAGWACHLSGYKMTLAETLFREDGSEGYSVSQMATQLLGLTDHEACKLFDSDAATTPEQMKTVVTQITGIEF